MAPDVRPLDPFAELCFHGLAHVPIGDAGCSFAPDYLAWAAAHGLSDDAAREDGRAIAASIGAAGRALLHAWPRLHRDLASMDATRLRALSELHAGEVADGALLAAMQRAGDPALELMHAQLSLVAPRWARVHADVIAGSLAAACAAAAEPFDLACTLAPSLAARRVELSWVLGPRGRGHPERLIVGAPAPWHDGAPDHSVVLALHEHAVRDLARGDWASVEWSALRRVAGWVRDSPLGPAHARWVGRLDLGGLLAVLSTRGRIDDRDARRLLDAPDDRAAVLAGLAPDASVDDR